MNLNEELAQMLYDTNRQISISLIDAETNDYENRSKANKLVGEAIKILRSDEK